MSLGVTVNINLSGTCKFAVSELIRKFSVKVASWVSELFARHERLAFLENLFFSPISDLNRHFMELVGKNIIAQEKKISKTLKDVITENSKSGAVKKRLSEEFRAVDEAFIVRETAEDLTLKELLTKLDRIVLKATLLFDSDYVDELSSGWIKERIHKWAKREILEVTGPLAETFIGELREKRKRMKEEDTMQNKPVTDLEAAKQMVKVFTDPIDPKEVVEKMQHATTNVQNVHRTRPFGALELHGKGISVRLKTLEAALKSLTLLYNIPDDSNVLPFIANAAAIFRKLIYKSPNGKKTACAFKKVGLINATKLPFPSIRELEQMLENRDIQFTYRSSNTYDKANTLSIHSFHKKMLLAKTYNALIPFAHLGKNLEDLAALLLTRNGKTYLHAYICALVTRQMNAPYISKKQTTYLVGDYGLNVINILDTYCDTIQSEKQLASFIQVFCVPLLSMWFNIRPIMTTLINVISENDFNNRLQLSRKGTDRESLIHGIWFIVMPSGYRVFKIEPKTGYDCDLDIQGPELDAYPLLAKYLPLIHRTYETLTNQTVTATSTEKKNYISCYAQKNKRYAFKYHVLPMIAPAWETGSSYYIQVDHAFETYAEVEGYTPLERRPNKSNLSRSDLNILKTQTVLVNGVNVGLKTMKGGCHPHASYFIPCTYGTSHPTKDASMKKVNQIYQDYLNGLPAIPPHLKLTRGCELAFSGVGRHFNTEITIDAIDFLKSQTVNRDFLEFLNEKERSMLKRDAHISKKIVRQHYKVFKDELKHFAGLNCTYDAYLAQRLASHPNIQPGEPFDQLVTYNGAVGSLKTKCHDMRNLTVMEQQAQSIAIKKFYQALVMLEQFEATGVLHRGVRCLYDRLKGVLDDAKRVWRAKHS
eukprot:g8367.t1